jgi:transcriptional regulator with XRE-family HTH domain
MSRVALPLGNSSTKLSHTAQAAFDRLVDDHGIEATANALGISRALVEKLEHGGTARSDSVAKVEAALRKAGAT